MEKEANKPGNGRGNPPITPKISQSRDFAALLALNFSWPRTVSPLETSQRMSSAASQLSIVTETISPPVEPEKINPNWFYVSLINHLRIYLITSSSSDGILSSVSVTRFIRLK